VHVAKNTMGAPDETFFSQLQQLHGGVRKISQTTRLIRSRMGKRGLRSPTDRFEKTPADPARPDP